MDDYIVIYAKYKKLDWLVSFHPSEAAYNKLIRVGFLTNGKQLTADGITFIEEVEGIEPVDEDDFEKFWNAFPATDEYAHFIMNRNLRVGKSEAKLAFRAALQNVTIDQLIQAINTQVDMLKLASLQTGKNQLRFIPSPAKWLRDGIYENYLNKQPVETKSRLPDVK